MNDILHQWIHSGNQTKPLVFCVVVQTKGHSPRKAGSKMIVREDGSIMGTVGGGMFEHQVITTALEIMGSKQTLLKNWVLNEEMGMSCLGEVTVFMESVNPAPRLLIFGAGHVGKAVAAMAADFGFSPVLIDHRKNLETPIASVSWHLEPFPEAWINYEFTSSDFAVVTTYQHEFDTAIVAHLLPKNLAYIGMMAGRNKARLAKKEWEDMGFSHDEINKVNMPIGVSIQCETPDEIALSIVSQIVDVKNQFRKNE
jgi:xanthine dehydrogenase accessory factor